MIQEVLRRFREERRDAMSRATRGMAEQSGGQIIDDMIADYRERPRVDTDDAQELAEWSIRQARAVGIKFRPMLDEIDIKALEAEGRAAIQDRGAPAAYPPDEGENLAFLAWLAILGEDLPSEDA